MRNYFISGYDFKLIQKFYKITNIQLGKELGISEASVRNIHKLRYVRPKEMEILFELSGISKLSHFEFKKLIDFIQTSLEANGIMVRITEQMVNLPEILHKNGNLWLTKVQIAEIINKELGIINLRTLTRIIKNANYLDIKEESGEMYYKLQDNLSSKLQHKSDRQISECCANLMSKTADNFKTTSKEIFY